MFDKLKNLEWLWSLGNLLWEQLVKWGVTATAFAMLTAAAAFLYSIAAWINSYGLAGWSATAFVTVLLIVLVIGMIAWSVGQVRRLKNGNGTPNAPAAERAAAVNEGRKSAQLDQQMQALNRTAFLLSTAAIGDFYRRRLEDGLKWYKDHPRVLPFNTNESLLAEISRVQEFINDLQSNLAPWPAPGSEDTELGVLMEPEVGHGEAEVYTRVQA